MLVWLLHFYCKKIVKQALEQFSISTIKHLLVQSLVEIELLTPVNGAFICPSFYEESEKELLLA